MSAAAGLKVDGPFVDRNAVIVPVSPGRDVALGAAPAAATVAGALRLSPTGTVRIAMDGSTQLWGVNAGYTTFEGVRDHVLNLGANTSEYGLQIDPTDYSWGIQIEHDYSADGGTKRYCEFQIWYGSPGLGFKRRPLEVAYDRLADVGYVTARGLFVVTATAAPNDTFSCNPQTEITMVGGRCDFYVSAPVSVGNPGWSFRETSGQLWTWGKTILSHNNNHGIYSQLNSAGNDYMELARLDNADQVLLGRGTGAVNTSAKAVACGCPLGLASYTVAQLLAGTPPATTSGRHVWCSNHFGGARTAYSDGADWRDVRTGLIVS